MNKKVPSSLRMTYARAVALRRVTCGLTQASLGKAAGLSRTYVGRIESGATNVSIDTMEKLRATLWADSVDKPSYKTTVAQALVASRSQAEMSQERLSELAHVSVPFISAVERGMTNTSLDQIEILATVLRADPLRWLGLDAIPDSHELA
jgi:transcriptional regulator with XRE-family HTH domain